MVFFKFSLPLIFKQILFILFVLNLNVNLVFSVCFNEKYLNDKIALFSNESLEISKIGINEKLFEIREIKHEECNCTRFINVALFTNVEKYLVKDIFTRDFLSKCGQERGPRQNVAAFTLFKSEKGYSDTLGVKENIEALEKYYFEEEWSMRVYTDVFLTQSICDLICKFPKLDWCHMDDFPAKIRDQMTNQRTWRFLVMGDPLVKKFIMRDMDSIISQRERSAVQEWEKSGKPIHIMRDHWFHSKAILAGMWDMNLEIFGYKETLELLKQFIQRCNEEGRGVDQIILRDILYEKYVYNTDIFMEHDSFNCKKYKNAIAWPTQRINGENVGSKIMLLKKPINRPCPIKCRPSYGKNWRYC